MGIAVPNVKIYFVVRSGSRPRRLQDDGIIRPAVFPRAGYAEFGVVIAGNQGAKVGFPLRLGEFRADLLAQTILRIFGPTGFPVEALTQKSCRRW